jgi:glycosidase
VNPDARQDHDANLQNHPNYLVRAPNSEELTVQRLMVAYQMFAPGAPFVYYGDEAGMWGADDPDCRKPMVWPDARHADEKAHPLGSERPADEVRFNHSLHNFYKKAIHMRKNEACLNRGSFEFLTARENQRWLVCLRQYAGETVIGIFNAQPEDCLIDPDQLGIHEMNKEWDCLLGVAPENNRIRIPAKSFSILKRIDR